MNSFFLWFPRHRPRNSPFLSFLTNVKKKCVSFLIIESMIPLSLFLTTYQIPCLTHPLLMMMVMRMRFREKEEEKVERVEERVEEKEERVDKMKFPGIIRQKKKLGSHVRSSLIFPTWSLIIDMIDGHIVYNLHQWFPLLPPITDMILIWSSNSTVSSSYKLRPTHKCFSFVFLYSYSIWVSSTRCSVSHESIATIWVHDLNPVKGAKYGRIWG